jgi:hypothetical protein
VLPGAGSKAYANGRGGAPDLARTVRSVTSTISLASILEAFVSEESEFSWRNDELITLEDPDFVGIRHDADRGINKVILLYCMADACSSSPLF